MGYTTDFTGSFEISRPLTPEHRRYMRAFAGTRRMQRDATAAAELDDPVREAAGLSVGDEGGYVVPAATFSEDGGLEIDGFGQNADRSVRDSNEPPTGQPGLWCQWEPNEDGTAIQHDEGEKFYNYVEWLRYLVEHFLAPWGYTLSGEVEWVGEDSSDRGKIVVVANESAVKVGRTVYDD